MDKATAKIAARFAARIKKAYSPEKIILFGSRARGDNFTTSDFDFIVVSEKFRETPFLERPSELYDFWDEAVDIEAICYTPQEFARKIKQHGIVRVAVREGVEL
ncbi:MAG: nucleotidyltransferase domain-containing protein [Acidobacteria bacterium]|nr:nucleotidyltransferase domain-containing protein [Acidobacteriota bacterium]